MAFSNFTNLIKTAEQLNLTLVNEELLQSVQPVAPPEWLSEMLAFNLLRRARSSSEMYAREFLVAPVFSFARQKYARLNLFSNDFSLQLDAQLSGTPDYMISYSKVPGAFDAASQFPLLAVAEAKRDDFDFGWAQCAAELYACRELNARADSNGGIPLWGIVTNGLQWEFGRMDGALLTTHYRSLDADPLEKLLGAVLYIFSECLKNGEKIAGESAGD